MLNPQLWQVFETHSAKWGLKDAPQDGHLIKPARKARDTTSQGTTKTTNRNATTVQTTTRTDKNCG